jgi:hypothetical protein
MNKSEALQTLIKVAKLQDTLLKKLASGEGVVSFESFHDFENAVKERIVDESENLEQELDSMESGEIKEAVNKIVTDVGQLFGKDDALRQAFTGSSMSEDQIREILESKLFPKVKNTLIFHTNNELKVSRKLDLATKLDELAQLASLTLEILHKLIKDNSNYVDTSRTMVCRICDHANELTAKKCSKCGTSLTKADTGQDMEGDELAPYQPPARHEEEDEDE